MSDNEIVETPEAAEPVTTEAPATSQAPRETFDQTIERVADEALNGKRGPDGKFQSRVVAPGAPETPDVPGSPRTAPPDPQPEVIEAPQSLPADVKAKWSQLPPDVQKFWADREGEIHRKFTTDGERLKTLGALEEVAKSVDARLKQVNAPAHEYFRRLAAADQLLTQDGIRGIQQIAQMYGIDLRAALQQPAQQTPTFDIESKVQEGVQRALQDLRVNEAQKEIDKFVASLPEDERADFEKLEPVMSGLASAKPGQALADLYKAARRADPETLARDEAKAKAEADKKAQEEAKAKADRDAKISALGKRPGSTPAAPIKGKNIWETMDKIGAEVIARQ